MFGLFGSLICRLARAVPALFVCVLGTISWVGCGGGSGGSSSTPASGSFTLSASPTSVNLVSGLKASVTIQVADQRDFLGFVNVTVSGLPAGVTVSPSSLSIESTGQFTLTAASNAIPGNAKVVFNGTSGSLTAQTSLPVDLVAQATPLQRPFTTVGGGLAKGFYDETRKLLFATNPFLNEVDVLSGETLALTARVSMPRPFGIDQMPDGKTLVIGTLTQAIYTMDEDTLAVTQYLMPNFSVPTGGPAGLSTTVPLVPVAMANGKVLLLAQDLGVDIDYIYGGQYIIEWDSNANTFTLFTYSSGAFFNLKRSADHNWAIFGGEAQELYLYNSGTDTFTSSKVPVMDAPYGVRDVAASPNGTQFAVASAYSVSFYDSGLNPLGTLTMPQGFAFENTNVQYNADGSALYWELFSDETGSSVVDVVNALNFVDLGNVTTAFDQAQNVPALLWVDTAQRAFESEQGGIGIFDCTARRKGTPTIAGPIPPSPSSIPLNASTSVSFGTLPPGSVVTFGGLLAPLESSSPLTVQVPASSAAGPVDLVFTQPDGETLVEPQDFSYGLDVAAATATMVPPTGNPTMALFGFGLWNAFSKPPTSVTIGGSPVPNMAALNISGDNVLQAVAVQLPNGIPGPANISVTGNNGTGVLKGALTYIPSTAILPANPLLQLLYDSSRNLVYALESTQIDVLDPTTLQWKSPLLPSSGKSYVSMALTPDASSMLVVDAAANTLTIFDPDNPTVQSITTLPSEPANFSTVVTTDTGKAFIGNHIDQPVEFDLTTLTATLLSANLFGYTSTFAATPDGSHMATAILNSTSGEVGTWNSSNDSFTVQWLQAGQPGIGGFWTDLAISPDGSLIAAIQGDPNTAGVLVGLFDEQLHYLDNIVYPDLAPPDTPQDTGAMFSPSGATLIVPLGDSIDFFDTSTGTLRGRLLTPEPLPTVNPGLLLSRTIALDPTATIIYAISASGLTILTLPTPVDHITPPVWPYIKSNKHLGMLKTARKDLLSRRKSFHRPSR